MEGPTQNNQDIPKIRNLQSSDQLTYGKIISRRDLLRIDQIHKIFSAVVSIFILIFYFALPNSATSFRFLTIQGFTITVICRLYAVVHIFLKVGDKSRYTMALNALQSFNFAIEGTIFVFYWAVLAKSDYSKPMTTYNSALNIFIHGIAFLVAAIPII